MGLNCLTTSQANEVVTDIAQKQKEGGKEREKDSGILRRINGKKEHTDGMADRKEGMKRAGAK